MSKQVITFGTPPTGVGGDTYRTAFGKCNENFTEVYDKIAYFEGAPKAASSFTIYRDVLSNYRATASLKGALVIHLPKAKNKSTTMVSFRIRGYNYLSNNGEWDLQVGGYNYTSGWIQCSANLSGPAPFTQVQLGMASDHQVIIIGTANTVWAYPRFNIEEITAGYSNHESGWNTGISAEYETNLSAYTGIVTPVLYGWSRVLTAEKLTTARTIGGVSFDGSANINLPGVNTQGNQNTTGNAATATKLQTSRTINGVSFDGTANITVADSTKLPLAGGTVTGALRIEGAAGANPLQVRGIQGIANGATTAGLYLNYVDQTTKTYFNGETHYIQGGTYTGNAASATTLATARTINGTSFNGSANITTANWGTARTLTVGRTGKSVNGSANVTWTADEVLPTGTNGQVLKHNGTSWVAGTDNNTTYSAMTAAEAITGTATTSSLITPAVLKSAITTHAPVQTTITGNAATATKLATPRKINGVDFDGSADITVAADPNVARKIIAACLYTPASGPSMTYTLYNKDPNATSEEWVMDVSLTIMPFKVGDVVNMQFNYKKIGSAYSLVYDSGATITRINGSLVTFSTPGVSGYRDNLNIRVYIGAIISDSNNILAITRNFDNYSVTLGSNQNGNNLSLIVDAIPIGSTLKLHSTQTMSTDLSASFDIFYYSIVSSAINAVKTTSAQFRILVVA